MDVHKPRRMRAHNPDKWDSVPGQVLHEVSGFAFEIYNAAVTKVGRTTPTALASFRFAHRNCHYENAQRAAARRTIFKF